MGSSRREFYTVSFSIQKPKKENVYSEKGVAPSHNQPSSVYCSLPYSILERMVSVCLLSLKEANKTSS